MDWSKGYTAQYYITTVDPTTWRDIEVNHITGGSIKREDSSLIESADVTCKNYPRKVEQWVRIWLDAKQNEVAEHIPLFTGLAVSPDREINGLSETNPVQCYSVLKPAEDVLLERGWYAPAGFTGSRLVKQLLGVSPAPVIEEGFSPSLSTSIIAENGESHLSMAEKILKAINWRIRISGDGTVTICPKPEKTIARFDSIEMDIIEPQMTAKYDWYNCPNVFRATEEDLTGIARDDSPNSPLSTVSRGREIWAEETNCDLSDNETVAEYAMRRLKEEQTREMSVSYSRRFMPDIVPADIVTLHLPAQQIDGDFIIKSQSIELGYGARVSEEVVKA